MCRRTNLRIGLLARSGRLSSFDSAIFTPVNSRKAPKMYSTQAKFCTSAAPTPIMMARRSTTPRMPQNNTRCW
ncbi:hypothetical protein D9M71_727540 [compost metagenome]